MTAVEALQTALAAEHAAVWVYGLLGGRTSAGATPELYRTVSEAYAAHRGRRDQLVRLLAERDEQPVAAEPAYEVSGPVTGPDRVRAVALETEQSCAATYSWLVANTVAEERRWAIGALNEAAVRELAFRGTPEMFPGAGEHADR